MFQLSTRQEESEMNATTFDLAKNVWPRLRWRGAWLARIEITMI